MSKRVLSNTQWRDLVSRLLKSEMSKRKLKYEDLSRALAEEGVIQTADNLRNKINRGILGADLFVQLLVVLNVKSLERQTLVEIMEDLKGL
ncbi:MAG: hypothetical protein EOO68_01225 [Moraxellaceae bacterium]|jgi:hypothetical protein|nr:MAG: hypothetical protein EOO68_01225 [Moraxellaceae bacterium]